MPILSSILEGIAASIDGAVVLTNLLDPENYETRQDMAKDLEAAIGYDPETFWNRKAFGSIWEKEFSGSDSDDETDADRLGREETREKYIDACMEQFEMLRDHLLAFAAGGADHDTSKLLSALNQDTDLSDLSDISDDEEPLESDEDDDDSLADMARQIGEADDADEDDDTIIDLEDEEE